MLSPSLIFLRFFPCDSKASFLWIKKHVPPWDSIKGCVTFQRQHYFCEFFLQILILGPKLMFSTHFTLVSGVNYLFIEEGCVFVLFVDHFEISQTITLLVSLESPS